MKYETEEERKAAVKAYQAAYRKAKKDGTWRPKSELGKGRVIDLSSSPIPHTSSLQWDEIVMPYLGSHDGEGARKQGKGRKLTPEEMRAAKSEWQRRYRELKRLAAGKPKRGRRKYATPEEARRRRGNTIGLTARSTGL